MSTPHDRDAEQGVLGAIIHDNAGLAVLAIVPDDFFTPQHRELFQTMQALAAKGQPIDETTLAHELRSRGRLDAVGGLAAVAELRDAVPVAANIRAYTDIVSSLARRRRIQALGDELAAAARDGREDALDRHLAALGKLNGSNGTGARRGFSLTPITEIPLSPPSWLIRDILEADTLAMAFGDPGTGKTFLAIDWAARIATGTAWNDKATRQGAVIYIAGEGRQGVRRRFDAWSIRHGLPFSPNLHLSNGPASLCDAASAEQVRAAVANTAPKSGTPALIVVDTLARNFGPGDENSTSDMNAVIGTLDSIRCEHQATVLLIHHTGHADKSRGRGAMSLKGALDAEYSMTRDDDRIVRLTATKMKDAPEPPPMAFRLCPVELDMIDEDGRQVTSAVLDPTEYIEPPKAGVAGRGKNQQAALAALRSLVSVEFNRLERLGRDSAHVAVPIAAWRDMAGLAPPRFREVMRSLADTGVVLVEGDSVCLADE